MFRTTITMNTKDAKELAKEILKIAAGKETVSVSMTIVGEDCYVSGSNQVHDIKELNQKINEND